MICQYREGIVDGELTDDQDGCQQQVESWARTEEDAWAEHAQIADHTPGHYVIP